MTRSFKKTLLVITELQVRKLRPTHSLSVNKVGTVFRKLPSLDWKINLHFLRCGCLWHPFPSRINQTPPDRALGIYHYSDVN